MTASPPASAIAVRTAETSSASPPLAGRSTSRPLHALPEREDRRVVGDGRSTRSPPADRRSRFSARRAAPACGAQLICEHFVPELAAVGQVRVARRPKNVGPPTGSPSAGRALSVHTSSSVARAGASGSRSCHVGQASSPGSGRRMGRLDLRRVPVTLSLGTHALVQRCWSLWLRGAISARRPAG
jgi:hypothetical protein